MKAEPNAKMCGASIGGWCRIHLGCGHGCILPDGHEGNHQCKCSFEWKYPTRQSWEEPDILDPAMADTPHFNAFFPAMQNAIERYGRACFNDGLRKGLKPAKDLKTWLTCTPPMTHAELEKWLVNGIAEAKKQLHDR